MRISDWSSDVCSSDLRIVTLMGKSVDYLVTLLAIWRIGAVQVPLFTAFAPPAIAYRLAASECKLIVCDPSQRCTLEFGASAPVNASWRILFTTGAQSGAPSAHHLISNVSPDPTPTPSGAHDPAPRPFHPRRQVRSKRVA